MALPLLSAMVSLLFMFSKTPLMMALLIVVQTTMIALSVYIFLSTSWLSFILFMIIVSAMMVIFVYVSSLASNDFLVLPASIRTYAIYFMLVMLLTTFLAFIPQTNFINSEASLSDTDLGPMVTYKLYASQTSPLTLFLIVYLLMALIVVAKISLSTKGALRSLKS